jgi:hypothetical protein
MTDSLLRAALLGTGRAAAPPADARLEALLPETSLSAERRLLLLAGMDAVRRRAGYRPAQRAQPPEAAPEETRPACSKTAGRLLAELLAAGNEELLVEAAGLLERAGQRFRPELLPAVLAIPDEDLREAFLPVLGERGGWLSRFHPGWSWAGVKAATALDPAEAKLLWTEGTFPERFSLLQRLRVRDPAAARELLASSWKEEKAEHRAELIDAMAEGLGADDEAFLESVLDDRSAQVRASAAPLLARIEGSGLAARMQTRVDEMLGSSFPFEIALPKELDTAWQRDGIPRAPPKGVGAKAWWLASTLALVRPGHLERRLSAAPAKIVAAAAGAEESLPLLQGLTSAALLFEDRRWAAPLFDAWLARKGDEAGARDAAQGLLPAMEPEDAEARLEHLFTRPSERVVLGNALSQLPAPWSASFSVRVAAAARKTIADPDVGALGVAAYRVAPQTIPRLAAVLERPDAEPLPPYQERMLDEAREVLRVRQMLHEQIQLPGRSKT